jgi:predicted cobalt transporter CbtA
LFLVPTLKYPANPPGVGNPQTIYYREILYVGFIATSGFTALALAFIHRVFGNISSKGRIVILPVIYVIVMAIAYVTFPPNPDKITMPMNLITSFRVAGAFTVGIFWWIMGITLGSFWDRLKPDQTTNITSV